jgi:chromosome partitioning protein
VNYPLDNEQQGMLDWFDDRSAERVPIREVRNRVVIKRAFNEGVSMFKYGDECDQEAVLLDLADDLLAQEVDDE